MPKNFYVIQNHIDIYTVGNMWGTNVRPKLRGQEVSSLIYAYLRCHDVKVRTKISVFFTLYRNAFFFV